MKKLLIALVAISIAVPAFSADYATKGVWELGGSAGYSSETVTFDAPTDPEMKTTTLSFAPEVGYFIQDNISLGLMLDYSNREEDTTDLGGTKDEVTTTELYLAPTYIFKQDKMYLYGGVLLGMFSMKNSDEASSTNYGVRGGVKVKVGENGLLNLGLQYLMGSGTYDSGTEVDVDSSELSFRAGFTLYL